MKVLLFANTDWYLYNFRLALAKALVQLGISVVLISPPGSYGARLQAEGFKWIPVPMNRRSLNPWSEAKFIIALVSLYKKERPDLVHHFTIKSVVDGSLAARIAGIPNRVNAVAGLGYIFTSKRILASLLRPLVQLLLKFVLSGTTDRLILQNRDDYAFFLQNHLAPPDHIRLIRGSGVNTSKFTHSSNKASAPGSFRVLLATRLLWDKGILEYVEAARTLKRDLDQIDFLIAGSPDEGNPASVPHDRIREWAKEGIIIPLGHVDNMPVLLSDIDLIVLPTSYGEGTPRILVEAAACGLPIVATDVPGCREIVIPNVNGLLVPVKDSTSLAEAIRYMAENPGERARMGQAGRKMVLEAFDEKIVIKDTIDVYRELLSIPDIATIS